MKRGLKIVISWLCLFSLFVGPLSVFGAGTGEISWPNPGATQLTKTAEPTSKSGEWKVTLKVEGKNIKTSSDVVLVIDKSGSMDNGNWWTDGKIEKAIEAANKFVDNLLLQGSNNRVAVVAFNDKATVVSEFKGPAEKTALKNAINGITATNGTNIQAGLKNARDLLASSSAQNKIIVVLSDGEPTHSFKGTQAASYSWANNSYGYALTAFNYNQAIGNGSSFNLSTSDRYTVSTRTVSDNGIGTISEAKLAKDAGYKIYSVGLDVANNSNAIKVLKDVQSEGYYPANSQELNTIFQQMAGQISYAAQNAKVIDPMGDMFNLKKQGTVVGPTDYTVSQGTVTWNAANETFAWDIGNIAEGTPATFTYTVVMDQSKNPVSNELYPTNGTTTLTYTDVTNKNVSKDFEVPKVSIGNGSVLIKGYLVNEAGKPINAEGVEVEGPEFAEPLYSEHYKDQTGKEAFPVGTTLPIAAKTVEGYLHQVGDSPKSVTLTVTNPTPTVWFGYTIASETSVEVKYLEQGTNKVLSEPTTVAGTTGQTLELTAKAIPGYTPVAPSSHSYKLGTTNAPHVFYYTANEQSVTVKYVDRASGEEIAPADRVEGVTGETVTLIAVEVPGYSAEYPSGTYTLGAGHNTYTFYYNAGEQNVEVKYLEQGTDKVLSEPTTVAGTTGQTLELTAKEIPGYTPVAPSSHSYKLGTTNAPHVFYYTANEQNVTVKYVDRASGAEIAEATTVTGSTNGTVTLEAKEVEGYTPEEATYEYTFLPEGNTYTFYYNAGEQNVEVKYLEQGTDKVLSDPTTVAGATGQTLELTAKEIPGYTPVAPSSHSYKLGTTNAPHVFYYSANEQSVTVKYVDRASGEEIAEATTVLGTTNSTVTLEAKEVEGYTPEEATYEYTFLPEGNTYTFYYNAGEQSVEVKYLEQGTDKILSEPTTVAGATGQTLELTAKEIPGYTPVAPSSHSYKLGTTNVPHVFYYTANAQSVTVKYVDRASGEEIAEATTVPGTTSSTVTLEAKEVEGYTPEEATYEYTFLPEGNEYIFYYTANEQSVSVTVKYVDRASGAEIANAETVSGTTNSTVTLEAKIVEGYTPEVATYEYTFLPEGNEYIFYYTANEQSVSVTVKYVDRASGAEIAEATTVPGTTNSTVTLEAKEVEGYTPEEATYEYTFLPEGNEYIFYYTANEQSVSVTVKYVDRASGAEISEATTVPGTTNSTVTLEAKIVEGYTPDTATYEYTFLPEGNEYTFYYTANQTVSVTVYHLDLETEEEIAVPTVLDGTAGTTLEYVPQPISATDGTYTYYPEELSYSFPLNFDPEQSFYVFYVKGDPINAVTLTVLYVDEATGEELGRADFIRSAGTSATLTAKEFEGYTPTIQSAEITLTDEPVQTYTFLYTKNAPVVKPVTIKYLLNGTNQQLADAKTEYGTPGETKSYSAIGISGYTPVQSTKSHTFSDGDGQELIFYYTRNSTTPPTTPPTSPPSTTPSPSPAPLPPVPAPLPPLPAPPPTLDRDNHYDYINGYPDGTVKPLNNITREEVAAIFYRLMEDDSRAAYLKTTNSFSDVGDTRWSNKHISTMQNAGIITGYVDGTFKPGQFISRSEFAAIASRFDQLDERENTLFSDITGHWAEKYIASAANKGWIKGYVDGTFKPDQYITRAEAAKFINSVLNRKVDHAGIHEAAKVWPDNILGKWYYYDIMEATNHHEYSREEESDTEVWEEVLPNRVYP